MLRDDAIRAGLLKPGKGDTAKPLTGKEAQKFKDKIIENKTPVKPKK